MKPNALITGISGQDGSYLAELLMERGYEVHGVTRSASSGLGCSQHLRGRIQVHALDAATNGPVDCRWAELIGSLQPAELYHLAADSFVPNGWERPLQNLDANTGLTIRILEAIRLHSPHTRLLNACSREIFGPNAAGLASEQTPMQPTTPYGINKAAARWMVNTYRDRYQLFAASAILFNHESPRRGVQFVTRKISHAAARIRNGLLAQLELGNLQAKRDWGFAGDYVDGMWRMLQSDVPEDFVIGTGQTHSIEDFAHRAFEHVGMDWRKYVRSVPALSRTGDAPSMAADNSRIRERLGWQPRVQFTELVSMMVDADLQQCQQDLSRPGQAA